MTLYDTNEPRIRLREDSADRTILALIRAGTRQCRFAAAFMAVTFGLVSQTAGVAYARSGETVLYLDAPTVSSERAERAGEVASDYSAPGSPATEEKLAWLALPGGALEPVDPPEEALETFASVTAPSTGAGVGAEEALAAGETMLAQLEDAEDGSGGEEGAELAAAGAVRPVLGDGSGVSEAEPEYEEEAAPPATQPETADPDTPQDGPPALASAPDARLEEGGDAPAGEFAGEPDGAGLVVAESGAYPEAPDEGGEAEFASVSSEESGAPPDTPAVPGLEEECEDYSPAGPVSDTGPPPAEEDGDETTTAPVEEPTEEARTTVAPTPPPASEPAVEPMGEPLAETETSGSSPKSTTAQPPPISADTEPTGDGAAEVVLVTTASPPESSSEYSGSAIEDPEPPIPASADGPAGPPESMPTPGELPPTASAAGDDTGGSSESGVAVVEPVAPSEASAAQTPASPVEDSSGGRRFGIVVGGPAETGAPAPDDPPEKPAPREDADPVSEAPPSPAPAPDGSDYARGRAPETAPVDSPPSVENPPTEVSGETGDPRPEAPIGESPASHEPGGPSAPYAVPDRPHAEAPVAREAPLPNEPTGGGEGVNEGGAPEVPRPVGKPEGAAALSPGRVEEPPPAGPPAAERREQLRVSAQPIAEPQVPAWRPAAHWPAGQAIAEEQQAATERQRAIQQAAVERRQAVATERRQGVEEQQAIERQAAEQAAVPQAEVEQAAAEEAAIVARQTAAQEAGQHAAIQQQAAEQDAAERVAVEQVIVDRSQVAYPASPQPRAPERVPAHYVAPTPEVAFEASPPISRPHVGQHEYATEVVEPTRQAEPTPQVEQPLRAGTTTEPVSVPSTGAGEGDEATESANEVRIGW